MISREQIIRWADTIFAHTDAYNFPAMFANRTDSRIFMVDQLNAGGRRIIIVSDILGSGKTFLLKMVMNELHLTGSDALICGRVKPNALEERPFIAIDEWDIKANPKRFMGTLTQVREFMETHDQPVVLLGDYTLRSDAVQNAFTGVADISIVPMEPLNPEFFRLALQQRIERVSERPEWVVEGEQTDILAPDLFEALVPDWNPTSANFRDVFRACLQLASALEPNDAPPVIGAREARLWLDAGRPKGMDPQQSAFYDAYVDHLRTQIQQDGWNAVTPMAVDTLKDLGGTAGLSVDAFREDVIEPLARVPGLIAAMGYPSVSPDGKTYDRFPGPFLPGIHTRLRAAFGG